MGKVRHGEGVLENLEESEEEAKGLLVQKGISLVLSQHLKVFLTILELCLYQFSSTKWEA